MKFVTIDSIPVKKFRYGPNGFGEEERLLFANFWNCHLTNMFLRSTLYASEVLHLLSIVSTFYNFFYLFRPIPE